MPPAPPEPPPPPVPPVPPLVVAVIVAVSVAAGLTSGAVGLLDEEPIPILRVNSTVATVLICAVGIGGRLVNSWSPARQRMRTCTLDADCRRRG